MIHGGNGFEKLMNISLPAQFAALAPMVAVAVLILTILVHVAFCGAVIGDGRRLKQHGKDTVLVGFEIWAVATLLGGVFVAAIYWAVHYSKFSVFND